MSIASERTIAGPQVNGRPSRATLFTAAQFRQYPDIETIKEIINESFRVTHIEVFSWPRLKSSAEYLESLGDDTFTYLLTEEPTEASTNPVIYAVCSAKVFSGSVDDPSEAPWVYVQAPGTDLTNVQQWELKILVVNPIAFRQGLGGYIMRLIEEEIKRRFDADPVTQESLQSGRPRRCQVVMTTAVEINGPFYSKHGYRVDFTLPIEQGKRGMLQQMNVASMSKML